MVGLQRQHLVGMLEEHAHPARAVVQPGRTQDLAAFCAQRGRHVIQQAGLHVADVGGFAVSALALRHRVPAFGYRIVEPTRRGHLDVEAARALGVTDGPDLGRLQRGETVPGRAGPVHSDQVVGPDRAGRIVTVLGDTTRCAASVSLARDADLVVHECTYANRDAALGEQWKHSTPADAAWVATTAGARRLLINHFSSRYDDPNELITEARSDFESTIAANELEPVDIPRC